MKKIIIGGTLLLSGILAITGILICGALNLATLHGWSGNKLIYSIFSMEQLNLGIWFSLAVLLSVIGLIVWVIELKNDGLATLFQTFFLRVSILYSFGVR